MYFTLTDCKIKKSHMQLNIIIENSATGQNESIMFTLTSCAFSSLQNLISLTPEKGFETRFIFTKSWYE